MVFNQLSYFDIFRYSTVAGKNLCPYFEWWSFPLSPETLAVCSELPEWEEWSSDNPLACFSTTILMT